jgi:hypothetical protein
VNIILAMEFELATDKALSTRVVRSGLPVDPS